MKRNQANQIIDKEVDHLAMIFKLDNNIFPKQEKLDHLHDIASELSADPFLMKIIIKDRLSSKLDQRIFNSIFK